MVKNEYGWLFFLSKGIVVCFDGFVVVSWLDDVKFWYGVEGCEMFDWFVCWIVFIDCDGIMGYDESGWNVY